MIKWIFILVSLSCTIGEATPADLCKQYQAGLDDLRNGNRRDVDLKFSPAPVAAAEFDSTWLYLDAGGAYFPLPEKPEFVKREPNETLYFAIRKRFFIGGYGPDQIGSSEPMFKKFSERNKIQTDYDYTAFLYSDEFFKCSDLKSQADVETKIKLAMAKTLSAPFVLEQLLHFPKQEIIVLAGPSRNKGKPGNFITNVFVKKGSKESINAMFHFQEKSTFDKFNSYLSHIKDKKFFSKAQEFKPAN